MASPRFLGVVVSFDPDRGFGFIRSRSLDSDVFVHIRSITGGQPLRAGQRVRFTAEASDRGPRAVRVEPLQTRLALSPTLAFWISSALWLASATLFLRYAIAWPWPLSWLLAVNLLMFALFALDKHRATRGIHRLSERSLLLFSFLGGSPAALLAMSLLRHKTRKRSFRLAFAAVVVAQVVILAGVGWLNMP